MVSYLYEWMKDLTVYLVLVTAVVQVVPGSGYKKYIRFFTGLILVLMIMSPVLKLFGMEGSLKELYDSDKYQQQIRQLEDASSYLNGVKTGSYLGEEEIQGEAEEEHIDAVKVEEIQIGSGEMDQTGNE